MRGAGASRTLLLLRSKAGGDPRGAWRWGLGAGGIGTRPLRHPWVPAEDVREAGVPGIGGVSVGAQPSAVTKGDVSSTRWVPALSPPQQGAGTMSGGSPGTGWLSHPRSLAAAGGARLPLGSRSLSPSPLPHVPSVPPAAPRASPVPLCWRGRPRPSSPVLAPGAAGLGVREEPGAAAAPPPPLYLVRMYQSVAQYVVLNLPIH